MKRYFIITILLIFTGRICLAQNINQNVNQNTIVINNQPVIEKKEYIIKYRPVYVEKPQPRRYARKLSAPVCLLNYIWVFPEDLGTYTGDPHDLIWQINKQGMYGRNNWRIPTSEELGLMENYASKCGLGDDIYLSTSHRNGVLRLVSTGPSIKEQVQVAERNRLLKEKELAREKAQKAAELAREKAQKAAIHKAAMDQQNSFVSKGEAFFINQNLWAACNLGTNNPYSKGVGYYNITCPEGWRLPTEVEFRSMIKQSTKEHTYYIHSSGLVVPFGVYAIKLDNNIGYIMIPNMMVSNNGGGLKYVRVVQDRIY